MRFLIGQGFLKFHLPMGPDFHAQVFADTESLVSQGGNPGDEIDECVPLLHEVFGHPVVRGVLASILGEDYFIYPQRHCH